MLLVLGYLLTLALVGLITLYGIIYAFSHTPRKPFPSELKYQTNDNTTDLHSLPGTVSDSSNSATTDTSNINLSLVIPCYNETSRLKIMLEDAIKHLNQIEGSTNWEIVLVDDGSKDGTAEYSLKLATEIFHLKPHQFRVIKLAKNRGKGGAVAHGMKFTRGKYSIFADADGASSFKDIDKLLVEIKKLDNSKFDEVPAVAIGSRAHMVNTDAVVKRSFIRNFLMYGLHSLVFIFGIRTIKDTQCGFKLFNKKSKDMIFKNLNTEGWIFDVEVLMLALRLNIPLVEVAINWHEVDGSKMDLAWDSMNMAVDLVVIRMAYILGIYKADSSDSKKTV